MCTKQAVKSNDEVQKLLAFTYAYKKIAFLFLELPEIRIASFNELRYWEDSTQSSGFRHLQAEEKLLTIRSEKVMNRN